MNQSNKKEALFYEKFQDGKIHCFLCPHHCRIAAKKAGFCGVRQNIDGKLYTLNYGKVSSLAADPIEKKPIFHFYPKSRVLSLGTYGCNMHCGHCQNWQISHVVMVKGLDNNKNYLVEHGPQTEYVSPERLVELAKESQCQGIAWTYNEPTVWFEYTLDGAKLAKKAGLYTVYVTNGYITTEALDAIGPYLDVFRVDIKGFSHHLYQTLCKVPDFHPILAAAEQAKKKWNMHVEVVTNIVPTMNDTVEELEQIADWIKKTLGEDTPWHVTRFQPYLDYRHLPKTPIETLELARTIGIKKGLKFVYIGNVPGHWAENTICPKCGKTLIERIGYNVGEIHLGGKATCRFCGEAFKSFVLG